MPLAEAWYSGANRWSQRQQTAFGNDIGYKWDLQAVTSRVNQDKGAGDPAEWLPPKNRCTYVKAWIGVKYRWKHPADRAEKTALTRELKKCKDAKVLMPGKPDIAKLVGSHGGKRIKTSSGSSSSGSASGGADPDPYVGLPPGAVEVK